MREGEGGGEGEREDLKEWCLFCLQFPSMCERLRFQVKDK